VPVSKVLRIERGGAAQRERRKKSPPSGSGGQERKRRVARTSHQARLLQEGGKEDWEGKAVIRKIREEEKRLGHNLSYAKRKPPGRRKRGRERDLEPVTKKRPPPKDKEHKKRGRVSLNITIGKEKKKRRLPSFSALGGREKEELIFSMKKKESH